MSLLQVPGHDVTGIRADNPGPYTLSGTNTWIVGRKPAWLIDPGPALSSHLDRVTHELERRGGLGGTALTHDHADHCEAVKLIQARYPQAPVAAVRGDRDMVLRDGAQFGPLRVVGTPGHAEDHVAFVSDGVGFSGDAVLGEGSVFIAPGPGALRGYLSALRRLRELNLDVICPGHGPVVRDVRERLDGYLEHRLERERHLVEALESGLRSVDELLDRVWSDAPPELRGAATLTLAAHLDKLDEEGRLPPGVERPALP